MAYSLLQSTEGTRVTSGTTISATYTSNVTAGSLLVAVIGRTVASGSLVTVGEVKDNQGNYWKQAVEFNGAHSVVSGQQGCDIWYCEKAGGGNKPAVTATLLSFPIISGINGMNMEILEYSGNSGVELVDQIGQALITTTSVTVTTNFNLAATNDLAISVVSGNMTAATVPSGWTSRLADTTQKLWIADNTAAGTSGSTLSAAWTSLTGGSAGSAVLVTFKQAGAASTSPTLLQMSYTLPAYPITPATTTATSQAYPVNPVAGHTLIVGAVGSAQVATVGGAVAGVPNNILSCEVASLTDGLSNTWIKLGSSGVDNTSGVDWSWFLCRSCKGGSTSVTANYNVLQQGTAFLLLEFNNLNADLVVDQTASVASLASNVSWTASTPANVKAGDLALAIMSSLINTLNHPSSGWTQVLSDTAGVGFAAMQLSTAAAGLTITWSGGPSSGTDILLTALCSASGEGSH